MNNLYEDDLSEESSNNSDSDVDERKVQKGDEIIEKNSIKTNVLNLLRKKKTM